MMSKDVVASQGRSSESVEASALNEDPFPFGTYVRKIKGHGFHGTSCGAFRYPNTPDVLFVNVQHPEGWVMHFRPHELERCDPSQVRVARAPLDRDKLATLIKGRYYGCHQWSAALKVADDIIAAHRAGDLDAITPPERPREVPIPIPLNPPVGDGGKT